MSDDLRQLADSWATDMAVVRSEYVVFRFDEATRRLAKAGMDPQLASELANLAFRTWVAATTGGEQPPDEEEEEECVYIPT